MVSQTTQKIVLNSNDMNKELQIDNNLVHAIPQSNEGIANIDEGSSATVQEPQSSERIANIDKSDTDSDTSEDESEENSNSDTDSSE